MAITAYIQKIFDTTDLLTFLAFLLAYLAYVKAIEDKYDSWKALLSSFKFELITMHMWLSTQYFSNTYDKYHYSPRKQVYQLTTVAAKEIVRKGINDIDLLNTKVSDKISLFIERIHAFNASIEHHSRLTTSNPTLSESLLNILIDKGLTNPQVNLHTFEHAIYTDNFKNTNEYKLMLLIKSSNENIHQGLISTRNQEDRLCFLYYYLKDETEKIIQKIESKKIFEWYVKYKIGITIGAIVIYIILQVFNLWLHDNNYPTQFQYVLPFPAKIHAPSTD